MIPSEKCYEFIKSREGFKNQAYQDGAGIWTIGYGTICYESGRKVMKGDTITEARASLLLKKDVDMRAAKIDVALQDVTVNQNQFDALVCFAYNIGIGGFMDSTVLKRVKANPADTTIREAFLMWNKILDPKTKQHVVSQGLTNRRNAEADLYFS